MKLDWLEVFNKMITGFLSITTLFLACAVVVIIFNHSTIWISIGILFAIPVAGFLCYAVGNLIHKMFGIHEYYWD
jgi:hypothetical protein